MKTYKQLLAENKLLTSLIRRKRKQLMWCRNGIKWCLTQDWSFGNHGPAEVTEMLQKILERTNERRK